MTFLKKHIPFILFIGLLSGLNFQAKAGKFTDYFKIKLRVGYNFGGTTPIGLPAEIRKINSYSPSFAPSIGLHLSHQINEKWGYDFGLRTEYKGMTTRADVKYYYTTINVGDDNAPVSGYYSGEIKTAVQNSYLSLPILATYKPNSKWELQAGAYVALLLTSSFTGSALDGYLYSKEGQKLTVGNGAPYDFSNQVRRFDCGFDVAAERKITERLAASLRLTWGLVPIFPTGFESVTYKMYNVYLNAGASYAF